MAVSELAAKAANSFGGMLLGTYFNLILWGVSITQTYLYFGVDRMFIRIFVGFVFLADSVQAVFTMIYMYQTLISRFGEEKALNVATWVFSTDPALTGIIGGCIQLFFAWRIFVLTKSWLLLCTVALFSIGTLLAGIGTGIAAHIVPEFANFQEFKPVVIIWLAASAAADILIAVTLAWYLRNHKTGFESTDNYIDRLIKMTVQTGMVTAVWATIDLLLFLLDNSGNHLIFNFCLAKLYTNSLMSSLNSRGGWGYSSQSQSTPAVSSGAKTFSGGRTQVQVGQTTLTRPEVFVQVESHEMIDRGGSRSSFDSTWTRQKS
ncbi:hypothetical protein K523DRAFT_372981 [Schizophyllum commune Tattone D]|nr:hypothetical protein K523DRAFT_372981 [Schizophyllum commune Tattone D]